MAQLAVSQRSALALARSQGLGLSRWIATFCVSAVLTPVLAIALLPAVLAALVLVPTLGLWLGVGVMMRV